jgi:hypothetical protein
VTLDRLAAIEPPRNGGIDGRREAVHAPNARDSETEVVLGPESPGGGPEPRPLRRHGERHAETDRGGRGHELAGGFRLVGPRAREPALSSLGSPAAAQSIAVSPRVTAGWWRAGSSAVELRPLMRPGRVGPGASFGRIIPCPERPRKHRSGAPGGAYPANRTRTTKGVRNRSDRAPATTKAPGSLRFRALSFLGPDSNDRSQALNRRRLPAPTGRGNRPGRPR